MNTLKFGNGEWYGKKDTILAYNDLNSNFKPLPFSFERDTTATRINKEGLIETVGSGEPRIDYKDDSKGALKLEPSRSNRVTYSEDLTQWTDYNASAVLSNETIYGKNAYKIVEDSTVNYHGIYLTNLFPADGTNYIWSVYVKGAERRYVVLTGRTGISSNASALIFDTQDGVWVLDSSNQNEALSAESVGNGWWRISMEGSPTSVVYDSYTIASAIGFSSYLDANYQGDGTSGIYVAMPQLEQGSYATSYIPTQGGIGTRVAEVCEQTPPSGVIGQTEGTLFVETSKWVESNNGRFFSISDGTTSNYIIIIQNTTFSNYAVYISNGGITQLSYSATNTLPNNSKIAISYKLNNFVVSVNGEIVHTDTSGTLPSTSKIYIGSRENGATTYYSSNPIKDARLYNTRLSNIELQALTT